MGRHRYRVNRAGVLTHLRDTPMKAALSRRDNCRRFLNKQRYQTLPEEPEVEETNVTAVLPVFTSIKPVHCKSVLRWSNPAFTENPREKLFTSATTATETSVHPESPAGHLTFNLTPEPEAFKGCEMPVMAANLTVTLGSITSSSSVSDTTFTSDDDDDDDDDDEEDCYSSASSSSSLPSPEISRRDSYVETLTPFKEELLGLHLHVKNSTLLEASHAESINMHHSPNLSNILDASTIFAEKTFEIEGPETETKIHTDSLKSEKAFKWKTPPKLHNRKPISYRKKVWFKSPIIAQTFDTKLTPSTRSTPGPAEASRPGETSSKEDALRLTVTLKRSVKSSPEEAKFFDFMDDSDRDAFFKTMRTRCLKLRSAPLFPLTALEDIEPVIM
ncbi:uncharacterized protein LOC129113962 [Anoplopoma fimbria]|uniref:uncharacterized protein LOC129113962 n=1 Tax=Anoplopoma fimbria TaxID=229290 RepID=UPI0023EC32EB|nr:uncharacterized protein LOC129113962 [Anoplopoma fimbria]